MRSVITKQAKIVVKSVAGNDFKHTQTYNKIMESSERTWCND